MIFLIVGFFVGCSFTYIINKIIGDSTLNEIATDEGGSEEIIFKEIENKHKRGGSDATYWLLSNKDENYLFTNEQLKIAKNRATKNPEDIQD